MKYLHNIKVEFVQEIIIIFKRVISREDLYGRFIAFVFTTYRSGMVNSNTVNLKFHLI